MSASIFLSLALLFNPAAARVGASPPGVAALDSGAWAVLHAGQLWVCWAQAADCWRRVELEAAPSARSVDADLTGIELEEDMINDLSVAPLDDSPEQWRLGFSGPRTLWIELGEQRWRVGLDQHRARATNDPAPLRLGRPRVHSCGPAGHVPAIVGGRLGWQPARRCGLEHGERSCVAPPPPRLRRPRALRLRAGLQLSSTQAWTSQNDPEADQQVASVRARAGVEFAIVVELGFDLASARAQQRAQAALMRRERVRRLPVGRRHDAHLADILAPLAIAEARALRAVLCEEAAR